LTHRVCEPEQGLGGLQDGHEQHGHDAHQQHVRLRSVLRPVTLSLHLSLSNAGPLLRGGGGALARASGVVAVACGRDDHRQLRFAAAALAIATAMAVRRAGQDSRGSSGGGGSRGGGGDSGRGLQAGGEGVHGGHTAATPGAF